MFPEISLLFKIIPCYKGRESAFRYEFCKAIRALFRWSHLGRGKSRRHNERLPAKLAKRGGFHISFNLQAARVSRDCGNGEGASTLFVGDGTIPRFQVSIDFDGIPFFCVTNILDGNVVVRALPICASAPRYDVRVRRAPPQSFRLPDGAQPHNHTCSYRSCIRRSASWAFRFSFIGLPTSAACFAETDPM